MIVDLGDIYLILENILKVFLESVDLALKDLQNFDLVQAII